MDVNFIKARVGELNRELQFQLSTWGRKDNILTIREEMIKLQNECPHYDNGIAIEDGFCKICGKQFFSNK